MAFCSLSSDLLARVVSRRYAAGFSNLLNDQEPVRDLDDLLDVRVLVTGVDDESARVRAHLLVDAERDGDAFGAGVVGAFADEVRRLFVGEMAPVEVLNVFVDLAKKRLVATGTFFPERHAA